MTRYALAIALAVCCSGAISRSAVATAEPSCKPIVAVQRDVLLAENCPSPVAFCAGGTITGNHGLRGTTFFSALSFDPIAGDPVGRLVVPGISTFTTDDGVLTISDVSAFDVPRGTFAGVGRIVAGTGRFAGATGDIFTTGRVGADGTTFVTDTTGEICVAP
jgi:hypothetical protein